MNNFPAQTQSLDPCGRQTTALDVIANHLLPPDQQAAWLDAMRLIRDVSYLNFPETIFWDFEFLGASLLREFPDPSELHNRAKQICRLQKLYGQNSIIRFRYVHDFVYGFDWAKWVLREPETRHLHGPFSAAFLDYIENRAHELVELIHSDDEKYPKLEGGEPRNPFVFSREPSDERRLFETLAKRDLIPVKAWTYNSAPVWNRPFAALRAELAVELGICK